MGGAGEFSRAQLTAHVAPPSPWYVDSGADRQSEYGIRCNVTVTLSTGIDVIEIERIAHAHERWGNRFLHRVYTERELAYCRGKAQRLAGRFASKEATSKVLGVGVRHIRWRDIEILPDQRGKPHVFLHGRAAALADSMGFSGFDVSITHSRTDAVVVVVGWIEKPS